MGFSDYCQSITIILNLNNHHNHSHVEERMAFYSERQIMKLPFLVIVITVEFLVNETLFQHGKQGVVPTIVTGTVQRMK